MKVLLFCGFFCYFVTFLCEIEKIECIITLVEIAFY